MNRATSVYAVEVEVASLELANQLADKMIEQCPVPVAASGVFRRRAFVRYRVADDEQAIKIATEIVGNLPHTVTTGYGVNARTIHTGTGEPS